VKLETQLNFLRLLSDRGKLSHELAQCHFTLLQKLQGALLQAVSQQEMAASSVKSNTKVLNFFKPGRFRYALVKDTLDSLVAELEVWQARFDPTWYLIILISGSVLDPVLAESRRDRTPSASARGNPLDNMLALRRAIEEDNSSTVRRSASLAFDASRLASITETIHMRYTSAKAVLHSGTSELLIMESVDLSTGVSSQSIFDVEKLARRLQNVDPDTFGILQCEGILRETDPLSGHLTALDVVYRAPAGTQRPTTLRHLLLTQREVSLNAIINLAKQLVRSVSYIHAWYVQPKPSLVWTPFTCLTPMAQLLRPQKHPPLPLFCDEPNGIRLPPGLHPLPLRHPRDQPPRRLSLAPQPLYVIVSYPFMAAIMICSRASHLAPQHPQ
jgi:hypothetical protein